MWQSLLSRSLDLSLVLAQLRRDSGQTEALIEFILRAAGETACALEKTIFVKLLAVIDGDLAQRNVVRLRSCEIAKGRAVTLVRHHAQIHL